MEKRKREAQALDIKANEMPLDFLLRKMRDPAAAPADQFTAARAAAPFCHPQLQAVAHRHLDVDGKPIAPMVTVSVQRAPPDAPRLTYEGPKKDDKVQ